MILLLMLHPPTPGVTSKAELLSPSNTIHPDMYVDSLADVARLAREAGLVRTLE